MRLIIAGAAMGGRLASLDAIDLILQAGWIVKLVLLLLAACSIVSWAIIYFKWRELKRAEQDSEAFLEVYHEEGLDAAHEAARDLDESPLSAVFLAGYAELKRMQRYAGVSLARGMGRVQLASLERQIAWTSTRENLRMERRLGFLATTGSAAPFVGLFGTVVGIIDAFHGIGRAGAASLSVVAPGIAEALIATAVGLLAAIPATVGYNYFVGKLRALNAAVDLFATEFEQDLERAASQEDSPVRVAGE